jgi:hypothetical protein
MLAVLAALTVFVVMLGLGLAIAYVLWRRRGRAAGAMTRDALHDDTRSQPTP